MLVSMCLFRLLSVFLSSQEIVQKKGIFTLLDKVNSTFSYANVSSRIKSNRKIAIRALIFENLKKW